MVSTKLSEGDPGAKYFSREVTPRERAIFEGAITLGALYHQFVGTPIRDPAALERAIEESALAHPFIDEAEAEISETEKENENSYEYPELSGKALTIKLTANYEGAVAEMEMRRIPEIDYPLMFIKSVEG
ncbi:hypothetical protein AKJ39_04290 [candidate division MSBL1 archaeon SCGC-AAA259J03]|uniref:Dihydroneopterin aldolase MtpD C-terminal domain-containing protein n=1 Tax=candidate division MSBL1 archaeon SCGC-AAA259J03 TaxID=1698269 RepID=A0A656YUZ9_9EURY|nr:hypothetical protein AKJ39_04290 [candidate division MSBL1 archaeon SCGC-AAA259J03]